MNPKAVLAIISIRKLLNTSICIVCVSVFIACSDSPTEDETIDVHDDKQPSLENMVYIPAGEFVMGSEEGEGSFDEHPQHNVYLDAYYIDKYEVTNAQFKEFVEASGYITDAERKGYGEVWNPKDNWSTSKLETYAGVNWQHPYKWVNTERHPNSPHPKVWENYELADKMDYPVIQVSWNDAEEYANWAGKRLPTEAEWEKAARATDGRKYPWGNLFNLDIEGVTVHANIDSNSPLSVGCFPTGVSSYGVYNLAGNVQEWTSDWYSPDYYMHGSQTNPTGPKTGIARVIRGGSWKQLKNYHVRSANRAYQVFDYSSNFVGFRCVWNESDLK